MFTSTIVSNTKELEQILALQKQFLRGKTSVDEEKEQGFLTVEHTLDLLIKMDELEHSIIVKDEKTLAGYALTMPKACAEIIPELIPMFENFDALFYKEKLINDYSFYVMGQICVDKKYRGKGVFEMLYQKHKEMFQHKYDFIITEISTKNYRSLRAHEKIGFKILQTYTDAIDEWAIVLWNWQ